MTSKADKNLKFFQNQNSMNGLVNFIAEMRNCRVRELEQKRVNKELANIRSKFKDAGLSGYQRKKYIAKLMYMYILGHDVDFGQIEAVHLLSSTIYSEKQIGYLAVTLLLNENHEVSKLIVHSIWKDLNDQNEIFNCLAIHAVANISSKELSESLVEEIYKKFTSNESSIFVIKKAGLCLLRLFRKYPEIIRVQDWATDIVTLIDHSSLGVVNSAVCLIMALSQVDQVVYTGCVTKAIMKLNSIVVNGEFDPLYLYYKIPAPWLQVKLLRLLQYYPIRYIALTSQIFHRAQSYAATTHKNHNQENTINSVVIETINYVIHLNFYPDLVKESCKILAQYLESKDTNLRYLALETMSHIAAAGDPQNSLPYHLSHVVGALKDRDISIARRALDLLYSMCQEIQARSIIGQLLDYLPEADRQLQEEMVLKIAILSEKFVTEYTWYVDVILKLITTAGDAISDTLWHRVIQIVSNHTDLREYAAYTLIQAVKQPHCNDVTVRIASYVLGEFGHVIVESPNCSPMEQFSALQSKFGSCTIQTQAMLLSTYFKFVNLFPEIKGEILKVFEYYQYAMESELQQRASEYLAIITLPDDSLLQIICEEMPVFVERDSSLLNQLTAKANDTEDTRVWNIGGVDAQAGATPTYRIIKPKTISVSNRSMKSNDYSLRLEDDICPEMSSEMQISDNIAMSDATFFQKLMLSRAGILYEDTFIQIGIKSQYQNNTGQLAIYFGNKSDSPFTNFDVSGPNSDTVKFDIVEQIDVFILAMTQLKQIYNVEAIGVPNKPPTIQVSYQINGDTKTKSLKLPVLATKFITGCILTNTDFFARWKQISEPERETIITFSPLFGTCITRTKSLLVELGLTALDGIDSHADSAVFACIFSCKSIGKVGCLVRVEVTGGNTMILNDQNYRVTVRSTNAIVSAAIADQVKNTLNLSHINE